MTAYWAEHAWLPDGVVGGVRFSTGEGAFVEVMPGARPEPGDEILHGVVLPGLANGHSHAFHRALRGRTHAPGRGGDFWTWRSMMYAVAARLDPDRYLSLARAVFAEMVLAGYTVVGEFHYLHHDPRGRPYADPNAMAAGLVEAAAEAGLRLTLLDTCYLAGGLTGSGHAPLDPVQARFSDGHVERWRTRFSALVPTDGARVGAAVHSVRAVPADALRAVVDAAGSGPLHLHLSEQPAENEACRAFYGRTPATLLEEHGLLGAHTTAVHGTHLSSDDIRLLGRTGTRVCLCPTTERDLGDGIGPALALFEAGSPLTLGSDQHAVIDPFEELRGLEMDQRSRDGARCRFSPEQLVTAVSAAGYASLGWEGGGRIAPRAPADFVVVRLDTVRTAGCRPDQVVYAATSADLERVVVAGSTVVKEGEHRLGSVAKLLSAALAELEED